MTGGAGPSLPGSELASGDSGLTGLSRPGVERVELGAFRPVRNAVGKAVRDVGAGCLWRRDIDDSRAAHSRRPGWGARGAFFSSFDCASDDRDGLN